MRFCHQWIVSHSLIDIGIFLILLDTSPGRNPKISTRLNKNGTSSSNRLSSVSNKSYSPSSWKKGGKESLGFRETVDRGYGNGHLFNKDDYKKKLLIDKGRKDMPKSGEGSSPSRLSFHLAEDANIDVYEVLPERQANVSSQKFVIV